MLPARVSAALRQARRPIGMQRTERADRPRMSHHGPAPPVRALLLAAQPGAVLDAPPPARELAGPRSNMVVHADVLAKNLATPAVMIACEPEDLHSTVAQLRERCESAEARAGNDGSPLEP